MDTRRGVDGACAARATIGTLALCGVWALLASFSPDKTYHLAPALITWTFPYLRVSCTRDSRRPAAAAIPGAVAAVLTGVVLDSTGSLDGPVLFGGNARGEAILVAVAAAVLAAASMRFRL